MPNVRQYRPVVTGPGLTDHIAASDPHPGYALESDVATSLSGKANTSHTHAQSDITNLASDLSGKQATLVSGTNIKTVGGTSLLGSGDVATLGYSLTVAGGNLTTMTDSQTIYYGGLFAIAPSTTGGNTRLYIPKTGTIKAAMLWAAAASTAGSGENWSAYIRRNDTTDTLVQTIGTTDLYRLWSNTGLSIAVTAGDYIEVKLVNPAWATNPADVRFGGQIYVEA